MPAEETPAMDTPLDLDAIDADVVRHIGNLGRLADADPGNRALMDAYLAANRVVAEVRRLRAANAALTAGNERLQAGCHTLADHLRIAVKACESAAQGPGGGTWGDGLRQAVEILLDPRIARLMAGEPRPTDAAARVVADAAGEAR
jgi:hypothetical protein